MAVENRDQLMVLLRQVPGLGESKLNFMIETAYFEPTGLRGKPGGSPTYQQD